MRPHRTALAALTVGCAAVALCLRAAAPSGIAELKRAFLRPPDDARIMMRWWWFGPAVTKPELERELREMKEGGIGGVEVQPVYPVVVDGQLPGVRNFTYLSDEFIDDLRFAASKARELGLRVDVTLGSGWPYGGPATPIFWAAPRLRVERVPVPANVRYLPTPAREGESLIAALEARGDARQFSADHIERLIQADNNASVALAEPGPGHVVLFFILGRTRMAVKRAAAGAEGFVLDHYSRPAIEAHLKSVGDRLMEAFGSQPPYAVFSDSLEVNSSDWAADFLSEFQKRRGYDLTPELPALTVDVGPRTAAIRHDWGKTLTELANERYLTPIREWAKRHGTLFRSQTYGTPPVTLSSNALVDLPEGEGSQWRSVSTTRWASSANHLYGNAITSSETWTWLHSPVFRATPLDMKAEADLHFLQGVNQLVGHGWPYSPPEAGEPGWHFYAAAVFNEHNPWWPAMPDITLYLQRISFLLRQGAPVNDVALYLPTDDAYARFTPGHVSVNEQMNALIGPQAVPQILDAGFNFDLIDDGAIAHGGIPYPVLILPGAERIPLASYRKIEEYARKGGRVIALRRAPSLAPGLKEAEMETPAIRELSRTLFAANGARGTLLTDESKLGATLRGALTPDMAKAPEIGFAHRKLPFAEVYFVANTSNRPVRSQAEFRVQNQEAAWWDPASGRVAKAASGSRIELDLAPYESRVIVFSKDRAETRRAAPGPAPAAIEIGSGWSVAFPGAAPMALDRLASWTELAGRRNFSGKAIYEKTVEVPAGFANSGRAVFLDFGEGTPVTTDERRSGSGMRAMLESPVREAAAVFVNGKAAGTVWKPPYEIEVTGLLRPGPNTLRIVVANLAINALAGKPLPDHKALVAKYGDRFQDQDMQNLRPLPSGILGSIRLIAK